VNHNETMHATPMSTTNHENNVSMLLLVTISAPLETRGAVTAIESEHLSKYTVIWKVFTGGKLSV